MTSRSEYPTGPRLHIVQMPSVYGTGGIARHVLDLSAWLEARGHRVTPISTAGEWYGPTNNPEFIDLPLLYTGADGGGMHRRLWNLLKSVIQLRRWLNRNSVDVIHAHESGPALVALLAVGRRDIPIAVTYHGSHYDRVPGFGRIAARTDLVITPSLRASEDLVARGGVAKDKVRVIGLGIKPAPKDNPTDIAALRAELLGDGSQLVVTLSRLVYQKGIDILIDVVTRVSQSHPHIRFAVLGEGPLDEEMSALARARGVADKLQFVGRTETPYLYLRAADMMVLTSRWEALPISIVEAFRAGKPVVATDCSGVRELVDGNVGACVPVGDVPAIADAVIRVLGDPQKLVALSEAAAERGTENRFDPDWVNSRFEVTYRELVQGDGYAIDDL